MLRTKTCLSQAIDTSTDKLTKKFYYVESPQEFSYLFSTRPHLLCLVKIDKCLVVNYAFGAKLSITKNKRETIFQSIWSLEFLKVFQNPIRIPKIPNREI